ncbi:MAG: hypothetical protein FJ316_05840 [SAR202 cluster bacterium]|nr:hypothetical protein [SAR202 cluster bacterium]
MAKLYPLAFDLLAAALLGVACVTAITTETPAPPAETAAPTAATAAPTAVTIAPTATTPLHNPNCGSGASYGQAHHCTCG